MPRTNYARALVALDNAVENMATAAAEASTLQLYTAERLQTRWSVLFRMKQEMEAE